MAAALLPTQLFSGPCDRFFQVSLFSPISGPAQGTLTSPDDIFEPLTCWRDKRADPADTILVTEMADLKVLCDDRLAVRGIVATPMAGPVKTGATGPSMQMDLGDTYSCPACARWYSAKLGYFTFIPGKPPQRSRFHPRCPNPNGNMEPMYIRRLAKDGCAGFRCEV